MVDFGSWWRVGVGWFGSFQSDVFVTSPLTLRIDWSRKRVQSRVFVAYQVICLAMASMHAICMVGEEG